MVSVMFPADFSPDVHWPGKDSPRLTVYMDGKPTFPVTAVQIVDHNTTRNDGHADLPKAIKPRTDGYYV